MHVSLKEKTSKLIPAVVGYSTSLLTAEKDGRQSLYAVQAERQEQAERSLLISCHSRTNEKQFLKYLSRHGDIKKCFFYESYVSE